MSVLREIKAILRDLSRKHKIACIIIVCAIVASICIPVVKSSISFSRAQIKCEKLLNADEWMDFAEIRFPVDVVLEGDSLSRVKKAISELEFAGLYKEEDYFKYNFTGTSMLPQYTIYLCAFSDDERTRMITVSENGAYCSIKPDNFALQNSSALYEVLRDIASTY